MWPINQQTGAYQMDQNVTQLETARRAPHDDVLIGEVKAIMQAEDLTQAQISGLTGIGKARLSQWLNGVYTGNVAAIEADIRRWLESRRAAAAVSATLPAAPGRVETPTARAVLSALSFSQMAEAVSVIYGGAGVGKSTALKQYQRRAPNVWVVTATPGVSALSTLS